MYSGNWIQDLEEHQVFLTAEPLLFFLFKEIWYLNDDVELLGSLAQMTDIVKYSQTPGDYSRMLKSVFGPGSGRDCCMAVFRLGKG